MRWFLIAVITLCLASPLAGAEQPAASVEELFARKNLVAWCIVPFDSQKRTPVERAAMLKKLGFTKFAYDWRGEHIPTFDAEIEELKKQGIELTAWWFPAGLNDDAKQILAALKRHDVKTQLWITMGDPAPQSKSQAEKVNAAVNILRPVAEAAAAQGCSIGLYNHGGWFGEPENQIAIIEALKLPNVGIVYNQHHGHDHIERFAELLDKMQPHLYALNLNGMDRNGERLGRKILPLAQGELDRELLEVIAKSRYRGPIGILGHTQDDAEARLQDNLDGLDWLLKPPGDAPRPTPRTPVPPKPKEEKQSQHEGHGHGGAQVAAAPAGGALAYDPQLPKKLAAEAKQSGSAQRGLEVFRAAQFACVSCHQVGNHGGKVGPALSTIGKTATAEQIAEAVLFPKRQVKPEFVAWQIVTSDGRSRQGYKRNEDAKSLELFDIAAQESQTIAKEDIEEAREVGTLMPDNLAASMSFAQQRDVVRFLTELGHNESLVEALAQGHQPATFSYDRAPLEPADWPLWQHPVNRDRLYDFYAKEAAFFRQQSPRPHLLPAFPGLDGGKLGHWGNQNEDVWRDGRWNDTDLGTVLSGVFHGPAGPINKGVCVRLGDRGELAACFNPETLCYEAMWRGGFLKFSDVRHGFMDGLRPAGEMLPRPEGQKPTQPFVYRGFYRVGPRVVFAYRLGEVEMLDAPWVSDGKFTRVVAPASEHPLKAALQGSPRQWPQSFTMRGELGTRQPYTVDTIPLPVDNPWKANIFPGDHGFLRDGTCFVCTMQGDVWQATGLDAELKQVTWRRFASGLHQALGMVIENDEIFVLGRDQITRLRDLNHDGEADFYECFSNAMETSPSGHDYTCGLARDKQGRFYTASGKEGLIRISADGQKVEVLATGFRNPDGLGLATDGAITVPCSEGNWTPASMICLVKPGESSSSTAPPHFGYGGPQNDQPPALPLVYLPRGLDNSSGGQATVPDDRWGPLKGQMIHTSFGAGTHFLLLRDEVAGQAQGAIVPLPGEFRSGAHRAAFNPHDGQLYVSGMAGWGSYTPDDGCLHRVRYTGQRAQLPVAFHVHENGVLVRFSQPIDPQRAEDVSQHFAQAWNYRYSPGYGSPEFATRHPNVIGHDAIEIAATHLVDKESLFIEMPELQPVNVLHLALQVDDGPAQQLFVTVHKLDQPFTKLPNYRAVEKTIAAHPQLVDLASLRPSDPNPWKRGIPNARAVTITAGKNLTFAPRTLEAKPGEALKLTFDNPDAVPHNWVLIKPGKLPTIGDLTNKLVADPEAVVRHYVPKSDDVLVYTDIVGPSQSFAISFRAPQMPGRYPFLCTFPGHWMVMNGELVVK